MAAHIVDMTGKRYDRSVALRPIGPSKSRGFIWAFRCDCGTEFEAAGSGARRGKTTCCDTCGDRIRRAAVTTHGLTNSPEYRNWCAMKARCNNPSTEAYGDYGGRGIKVCDRWMNSFELFLADMGPRTTPEHTVDRKDHDGDYEPGNCEWATREAQGNNKRNNRRVAIGGTTKNLTQWARIAGISESTVRARLSRGLTGPALLQKASK